MDQVNNEDIFIVGIGASAGGLEAIRALLKSAPRDAPAAYVVVQHMAPTQKSMLTPLIARETHLETTELADPVRPQRNHVYVGPPGTDIVLEEGHLKLVPPSTDLAAPKPSADRFFRTLAEGAAERAIGIVLSGTGSDGSDGVKAIHEAGGITFAQDDKSAKYDGMPNSAIETGCIDLVLSPLEMGQRLESLSLNAPRLAEVMKAEADQVPLTEILQIVLAKTRVDFRDYKPTTILRRLERRMAALGILSQQAYAAHLREHDDEVEALFRDFLISVTRFFRDPEQYEALQPVIEKLAERIQNRPIRVWVAGCATGEEAYSVAMLFAEAMGGLAEARTRGVQIFATDIDQRALKLARAGRYPAGALADVPTRFIKPYFTTEGDFTTVAADLKSMILFSVHNVVQDPPFKDIDLVCCRNLLIYFNPVLQDRTFGNFHYSLRDNGLVFLGVADNAMASEDLFIERDMGVKVLEKRATGRVNYDRRSRRARFTRPPAVAVDTDGAIDPPLRPDTTINPVVRAMAASLGEASVLLTRQLSIVYIFGDITPYVSLKEGRMRSDLDHNMLVDPLAAEVRVLSSMVDENRRTRRGFTRRIEGRDGLPVQLEMILLKHDELQEDMYLVVFNRVEDDADGAQAVDNDQELDTVQELRDELTLTRDALNQAVERWETANEELKAANEEMQSNNEELQSINEELETSNEELQSTNEELVTINEAYQVQTDELNELNEELEAILDQVDVPLIVFNTRLMISQRSQAAATLFQTGSAPGKMHVSQLALPSGFPPLAPICHRAIHLGAPVTEEFEADGRTWWLNCSPFTNLRGELQGGTLFVTSSREEVLNRLLDQMPNHMSHMTADGTILRMSRQAAERLGVMAEDAAGRNLFDDLLDDETGAEARRSTAAFMASEDQHEKITQRRTSRRNGSVVTLELDRQKIPGAPGQPDTVLSSGLDITERLAREAELEYLNAQLSALLDQMPSFMVQYRRDGTIMRMSHRMAERFGTTVEAATGSNMADIITEENFAIFMDEVAAFLDSDRDYEEGVHHRHPKGGPPIVMRVSRQRVHNPKTGENTVIATGEDITERLRREAELARISAERELLLDLAPLRILHRDRAGRILWVSRAYCELMGHDPDRIEGMELHDFFVRNEADAILIGGRAFLDGDDTAGQVRMEITVKGGEKRLVDITRFAIPAAREGGEPTVCSIATEVADPARQPAGATPQVQEG